MATSLQSFSTLKGAFIPTSYPISSTAEVEQVLHDAATASIPFSKKTFIERAEFLEAIAEEIMELGDLLLEKTHEETALPIARLTGERGRTCTQLKLYADLLRNGAWCDAVIDTAMPNRQPLPRADLRRILQPIGPVLVFGASNFPYAYSTAGGDTASALAAGCPVIVKAHESHLGTSELVAKAVLRAAEKTGMPKGVFESLEGTGPILGQQLAADERIQAIGFTGSYKAGMALYTTATQKRKTPIPVYAEMSSINPVILLPELLAQKNASIAAALAGSISLGVGQFCTSPGLIFALDDNATHSLQKEIFGPCSLLVVCKNEAELYAAIASMEGQLTGSVYGSTEELIQHQPLVDSLQQKVGRLIFNNVPTGVEVCNAIVHGGPFPATTDARTTSVGPEAIRRFARPVCYQDCPEALLPLYLRNNNEAGILRLVDGVLTNEGVE